MSETSDWQYNSNNPHSHRDTWWSGRHGYGEGRLKFPKAEGRASTEEEICKLMESMLKEARQNRARRK
jgi:hypothetical protein